MRPLILLAIILVATFGAGTVDVLFPDVIPLRPYTGIFQISHDLTGSTVFKTSLPLLPVIVVIALLIMVTLVTIVPHLLPGLTLLPLGSRGSHSRANRRAGAGWTNKGSKQPVSPEDQFRILMEIFGRPRVVMIYDRQRIERKNGKT